MASKTRASAGHDGKQRGQRAIHRSSSCGSLRDAKRCPDTDDVEVDQLLRTSKKAKLVWASSPQSVHPLPFSSKPLRIRGTSRKARVKQARISHMKRMALKPRPSNKSPSQTISDLRTNLALAKHDYKQQVAATKNKEAQLSSIRDNFDAIGQELECPICKDTLVRPSALVPCGHVYCESCLLRVFTTPLPDELPETMHWERPKNCPDCRAAVHHAPIPIHIAKSIITKLHPEIEHSSIPRFGLPAGFDLSEPNPWEKIFPTGFEFDDVDTESDGITEHNGMGIDGLDDGMSDSAVEIEDYLPTPMSLRRRAMSDRVRRIDDHMLLESQDGLNQLSLNFAADGYRLPLPDHARRRSLMRLLQPVTMAGTRPAPIVISDDDEPQEGTDDSSSLMDEDSSDEQSDVDLQSVLFESYRARHSREGTSGVFHDAVRSEPSDHLEVNDAWTPDVRRLAARGVTPAMQRVFNVKYSHSRGIYIEQPPHLIFYVGWNIRLFPEDESGDIYISYLRWELENHPERWKVIYVGRVRSVYRLTWVPRSTHRSLSRRRA